MSLTIDQLKQVFPQGASRAAVFLEHINAAMDEYDIDSPLRQQAFLAQIGHESGQLRYTREIWGPTEAQKKYEGRLDLGNTVAGDGKKFMGRGLIQITGRANYKKCSNDLFGDNRLLESPEILESAEYACKSAAWFWAINGLNGLADKEQFAKITRKINGGLNGQEARVDLLNKARRVII